MATNQLELAQAIDNILNPGSAQVKTPEEALALRKKFALALAAEIDAYVQYQIGQRLGGITQAVNAPGPDGNPVPLSLGSDFSNFTRTS